MFYLISLIYLIVISFVFSTIVTTHIGAPFVPTISSRLKDIFSSIKIKKNDLVFDLGSGDGKILRFLSSKYQIRGIGIEINPYLVFISKLISWYKKENHLQYYWRNFMKVNLSGARIIYFYLMPKIIPDLKGKIEREVSKNTIIISHRFEVMGWEKKLIRKVGKKPPYTFVYNL